MIAVEEHSLVRRSKQPSWFTPMLATLTETYFSDPAWIFEPKLDGVRCLAFKRGKSVRLLSRNRLPLDDRYPEIAEAMRGLDCDDIVLDGEAAVVSRGVTSFQSLQRHLLEGGGVGSLALFAFDVPFALGND
ncbi:MAG: ATP-dependent DNA ligase, partial [Actinomycetota bacterium]|nr:ATP-dependent DNA ligase [Actinomycetota bacterium]